MHSAACPKKFKKVAGSCLRLFPNKANFFNAYRKCDKLNATLLLHKTEKQQEQITKFLIDNGFKLGKPYEDEIWIGIAALNTKAEFVSEHDQKTMKYMPWLPGEPNNRDGNEECVVYTNRMVYGYNDVDCNLKHKFVVKLNKL
ncbi:perlucin-like protein [Drosophila busckii]|uniref:perlucin-like protein n=1 Tax=Drosophila busckii TaxID=30019 RepID=UPI0014329102|nr:perlucin-like protein [Drosophila busckii]